MSLFDDNEKKRVKPAGSSRDKVPETPDFKEWGREPRKGNPFLLESFSPGSVSNTTKP